MGVRARAAKTAAFSTMLLLMSALVACSINDTAPAVTPTPAATPSPTPTPTPMTAPAPNGLGAAPAALALYGIGSGNAATITVAETSYNGTFGESDTCAGSATVVSATPLGPSAVFTVTGVAAGSCSATFSDTFGQTVAVSIGVTTSGFGVRSHARKESQ